ncbi:MAG: pilus assembly protein N-terminal domain-containing protein [Marinobacter sp.]|nr:pilus assembly protein N-terminal domain-containing protein [Marinobacter sp.]
MFVNTLVCRLNSLLFIVLCTLPAFVQAGEIRLAPGEQQVMSFPERLTKVAISNPEVASVNVSGRQEILITANGEGSAVLNVWLGSGTEPERTPVVVAYTLGDRVPHGTQVQTDIRILEVSRSELNSLGVYYANLFNGGRSAIGLAPPGSGFRGFPGAQGGAMAPLRNEGFNLFSFGRNSLGIVAALESGGFAYTLAEPSLTSLSGQQASFLSGGEFPVPVSSDVNGTRVEYKKFGVALTLTPTVINSEQIILAVAPEVSELDFSSGIESGGVSVPGLRVRRAETTVSLGPGETFIISGLVSRSTINNSDRVPGLGRIPVLGALFRSDRIAREDKELIMVVTPYIVSPLKQEARDMALPGRDYHESSTGWLDMATQSGRGSRPIRHGLSW